MKEHKTKIIWAVVILGLVGLLYWGGQSSTAATWEGTDVACLPNGHQNLAFHIHADLAVFVGEERQSIGENIGITPSCMAEVHTHEGGGYIHIESVNANSKPTLGDFFAVWDEPVEREGYERIVRVNGSESDMDYVFRDGDQIEIRFTSVDVEETATSSNATTSDDGTESFAPTTTPVVE